MDKDNSMEQSAGEVMDDAIFSGKDNISFPKLLLWHLNRISGIMAAPSRNIHEKAFSFNMAVDGLGCMLSPYLDAEYRKGAKAADDKMGTEAGIYIPDNPAESFALDKPLQLIAASKQKLKLLMELMARKNLLLAETAELEVKHGR